MRTAVAAVCRGRLDGGVTFDVAYLARHGQTEWNRERRGQGRLDSPLTPQGRQHAADLARLVSTLDIDVIASSPTGRALTTAHTAAEALGMGVEVIDELAELDHGEFGGLTPSEMEARWPGARAERAQHKYVWRFPGGESYADADERAAVALGRIARSGALRPLIVSHEMVGRMVLRNLLGLSPEEVLTAQQPHNLVYEVTPSTGQTVTLDTGSGRPDTTEASA